MSRCLKEQIKDNIIRVNAYSGGVLARALPEGLRYLHGLWQVSRMRLKDRLRILVCGRSENLQKDMVRSYGL
jgi:hypothetical protein